MGMYLGVDTSCYTTSLAAVDAAGSIRADVRQVLPVPLGEKGLAQSTALFQHIKNLPLLLRSLKETLEIDRDIWKGIAVSSQPRRLRDSYMPVFLAGWSWAQSLALMLGIPWVAVSHQEGHIMAGKHSSGLPSESFLAIHLSGGTSEVLLVKEKLPTFEVIPLGGTTDLPAGQFVDRVGVMLGLPFPCGRALEKLAQQAAGEKGVFIPSSVKDLHFSFSGPETCAQKLYNEGIDAALIARATERCIAATLEKVIRAAVQRVEVQDVLLVGGVTANSFIRQRLEYRLDSRKIRLWFAAPGLATDNAVGVALLARSVSNYERT